LASPLVWLVFLPYEHLCAVLELGSFLWHGVSILWLVPWHPQAGT
jgi:hypothetical protein